MPSYVGQRLCAVDDRLGVGDMCRWSMKDLKYCLVGSLPSIAQDAILTAIAPVFAHISSVCDLRFTLTSTAAEANIVSEFGAIDGPYGVLGWSQLPCGAGVRQLKQLYDVAEPFVLATNPPDNKVGFPLVYLHEVVHACGCPHLSGGVAVMNPQYNPALQTLQPLDRAWLVSAYGLPLPGTPTPLPPPIQPVPPTAGYSLTVSPLSAAPGQQLSVVFTAPAGSDASDWVGMYKTGAPNMVHGEWHSPNGATNGVMKFTAPTQLGSYEFRYLLKNGYTDVVATSPTVTVTGLVPPPPVEPDQNVGVITVAGVSYTLIARRRA